MKNKVLAVLTIASGLVAIPGLLLAHHGTAGCDIDKVIALTGTVTAFEWFNPHVVTPMDVKADTSRTCRSDSYDSYWLERTFHEAS